MIEIHKSLIEMHTRDTSYILHTGRAGLVEAMYYGGRLRLAGDDPAAPLLAKATAGYGGDVLRGDAQPALSSLLLELSPQNRGDYRAGALLAKMPGGAYTTDFVFRAARLLDGAGPAGGMPYAREPDDVLALSFSEGGGLAVELFYSLFYEANVITKRMRITNRAAAPVYLVRALSSQLDLPPGRYEVCTLTGAWARETHLTRQKAADGTLRFGSVTGASGARCNPFFFLAEEGAGETAGNVYGFNLVYSGSHEGSVEVDAFGRVRVMHGVQSEGFEWRLAPGESFLTPEAVLTFSDAGKTGMSHNMHRFVKNHILPPRWKNAPRPVLVNNWEGTYFNFTEKKLMQMARVAAGLGAELFVLDDGWFGRRNNDRCALGDYSVNRQKLPGGIDGLAERINRLGMEFGLWFEPEMVSRRSELYAAHPEWAVHTPGHQPATGRHQLVLNLCLPAVREYIVRSVNGVLDSANIRYVKWDMNRHLADNYSENLACQGEFAHRFALGLYQVLAGICQTHPDVLFEGCSSGGNRYDLGMLFYMPQVWVSDDSDAHERQMIQTGASYGYPQCTMGCHVSAVPNHQTLRDIPLDTRFNTAMFGLLGYELDLTVLTKTQKRDIKEQIAFYKEHRQLLQYGDFYRLRSPFEEDGCRWAVVSADRRRAVAGDYMNLLKPNSAQGPLRLRGLAPHLLYEIAVRRQKIGLETFGGLVNYILPLEGDALEQIRKMVPGGRAVSGEAFGRIAGRLLPKHVNPSGLLLRAANKLARLDSEEERYTAYGDLLCKAGLFRQQEFSGAGYGENLRFMQDYASRVYVVRPAPQNGEREEVSSPPGAGRSKHQST